MVVIHHGLLTSASLASAYISGGRGAGWSYAVTYTPLHFFWAGKEAVIVFFVLSGLVLTLPRLRSDPESWKVYYPKRLLRLYMPIFGAVLVSMAIVVAVGRTSEHPSWWMNIHTGPSVREFVHDVTLISGPGALNPALWSLQWEVWFSLLLPAYVLIGAAARRLGFTVGLLGVAAVVIAGLQAAVPALMFMPVFGVGVLIAVHLHRLRDNSERLFCGSHAKFATFGVLALAVGAVTAEWWSLGLGANRLIANIAGGLGVLTGAVAFVLLALYAAPVRNALQLTVVRWLGTRSFSLYLIHEPIVVSVGELLPDRDNPAVVTALGLGLSLLCAEAFYRAIEKPSHQFARRIGAAVSRRSRI